MEIKALKSVTDSLLNKKILILGFGREGKSTLEFLIKNVPNADITIADLNDISGEDTKGAKVYFGKDYQKHCNDFDVIIKSPGIVLEDGVCISKITSQTQLFLEAFSKNTIGITGTKGKSTVTTLTHHILSACGKKCVLLGNIGIPPLDVAEKVDDDTICVFELSAHQLEHARLSPHISVLINLYPEHLDHYGTYEKYVLAKENIFKFHDENDIFVCADTLKEQIKKYAYTPVTVSSGDENCDYYLDGRRIASRGGYVNVAEDDTRLLGENNLFDIALVYAVIKNFKISDDEFKKALKTYVPLAHRMEFIGEIENVRYYDDSISTIGATTINALKSIKNVGTVIIGGMDRGIDYDDLIGFLKEYDCDDIILIPDTGKRILHGLQNCKANVSVEKDLKSAAKKAKLVTKPGKACVLSPAAASYGFFKNFEERGDAFKKYIFEK